MQVTENINAFHYFTKNIIHLQYLCIFQYCTTTLKLDSWKLINFPTNSAITFNLYFWSTTIKTFIGFKSCVYRICFMYFANALMMSWNSLAAIGVSGIFEVRILPPKQILLLGKTVTKGSFGNKLLKGFDLFCLLSKNLMFFPL